MLSAQAIDDASSILEPADFYRPAHGIVFGVIVALAARGEATDLITVPAELRRIGKLEEAGGLPFIADLLHVVPSPGSVRHYAGIVANKAFLRRQIAAGSEIYNRGFKADLSESEMAEWAEQMVLGLRRRRGTERMTSLEVSLSDELSALSESASAGHSLTGLPTGFGDLDRMTGGWQKGDLIIVGGRPSMGKSVLGIDFAVRAAENHRGAVALFSLEMSRSQINRRLLAGGRGGTRGPIEGHRMRSPASLTDDDWSNMADTAGRLHSLPIWIDDSSSVSVMDIRSSCRRLARKHGLSLVVIDYMQLMDDPGSKGNANADFTRIANGLKQFAKDSEVPVVVMSQLSRNVEHRNDKRPMLSDLRESGAIEQAADIVMMVYRDGYYSRKSHEEQPDFDPAEVIIRKQRNGPTGTLHMMFSASQQMFHSMVRGETIR